MNNLNAFIVKFGKLSPKKEEMLEILVFDGFVNNFTDEEVNNFMIKDEKERTLIVFIHEHFKYKLDNFVNYIKKSESEVIEIYEDITEKFIYKNDFSDYNFKSELINKYIKSNLTIDDVLDKIIFLGKNKLTEIDMEVLSQC